MFSQSVRSVHSAVPLFGTIFVGETKIDKVSSNTVSKISHFNLNVTCFKGLHRATIKGPKPLWGWHTTRTSSINDTFTPQRCCFGHYFVSDPSLHLFFLVWWNQFPKHKIARQMFAWRSHPLASKGAFCM